MGKLPAITYIQEYELMSAKISDIGSYVHNALIELLESFPDPHLASNQDYTNIHFVTGEVERCAEIVTKTVSRIKAINGGVAGMLPWGDADKLNSILIYGSGHSDHRWAIGFWCDVYEPETPAYWAYDDYEQLPLDFEPIGWLPLPVSERP